MRKTKIVCTLGPASDNYEIIKAMIKNGMNVARLNFSHANHEQHLKKVNLIKQIRNELKEPVALLLDTKGPEIRTGLINKKVHLKENDYFTLYNENIIGNENGISISYRNLYQEVKENQIIFIDDGLIKLKVISIKEKNIVCKILVGGEISNNKSVNIPNLKLNLPSLTEKDVEDIKFGIDEDFDYIAASFVRESSDILAIRNILNKNNGNHIKIIAKIENHEGVKNFDEILKVSDGIMVARGDLGVEIDLEEVPILQKMMIKKTYAEGKIVITATQMLDSMIHNPTPTRAEVSDIANAIYDGTSAIMLSGETANGKYPIECIKVMNRIALKIEGNLNYWKKFNELDFKNKNFEFIIDHAMCTSAMNMNVKAIACYTVTTNTPSIISSFKPECLVYAITKSFQKYNQMALFFGITPKLYEEKDDRTQHIIINTLNKLKENKELNKGDVIIIAGGKYIYDTYQSDINKSIGGIYKI